MPDTIKFEEFAATVGDRVSAAQLEALRTVAGPKQRTVAEWEAQLTKLLAQPVPRES